MNKNLLSFAFIFSFIGSIFSQELWDNFEDVRRTEYGFFSGLLFDQEAENPETDGVNTSEVCARYVRNGGELYDVIIVDPETGFIMDDLSGFVDGTKKMSLLVNTTAAVTIQITLENKGLALPANYPTGRHSEYTVTTSGSGIWEEFEFNFVNRPDPNVDNFSVDRMVILFAPNTNTADEYFFDDLFGPELTQACVDVVMDEAVIDDFNCQRNVNYEFTNGSLQSVENPNVSMINDSEKVGRFTKFLDPSDGAFGGALINSFNTATYNKLSFQLYDLNDPQDFFVIFQDASSTTLLERTVTTSSNNDWQEFEIPLIDIDESATVARIVLLLEPGSVGENSIYLDNFVLSYEEGLSVEQADLNLLKAYPNPVTDLLLIESDKTIQEVRVFDNSGRLIDTVVDTKIDFTSLPNGVYHVTVMFVDATSSKLKVVK